MLAVVLVLHHRLGRPGVVSSRSARRLALGAAAIGVSRPVEIGRARDRFRSSRCPRRSAPAARRRRRRAWSRTRGRCRRARFLRAEPRLAKPRAHRRGCAPRSGWRRPARRARRPPAPLRGRVDLRRKRVAEKAGDAQRHVDARPLQLRKRHDLDAGHPAADAPPTPGRAPISASACAMSSPPVRMFDVPQTDSATLSGYVPSSRR